MVTSGQTIGELPVTKPPSDPVLAGLREVARGAASRSRLGVWMSDNLPAMTELVRGGSDWPGFAAVFIANGIIEKPVDWDEPGAAGAAARARAGRMVKQAFQRAQRKSGLPGVRKPRSQPMRVQEPVRPATEPTEVGDGEWRLQRIMDVSNKR